MLKETKHNRWDGENWKREILMEQKLNLLYIKQTGGLQKQHSTMAGLSFEERGKNIKLEKASIELPVSH